MIQDKNQFQILPIPTHKLQDSSIIQDNQESDSKNTIRIRMCVDVYDELAEKIKDLAYESGRTQAELLLQAVEEFVKDKTIKSRPESLKIREKARKTRKSGK